jgi:hypothetical protein
MTRFTLTLAVSLALATPSHAVERGWEFQAICKKCGLPNVRSAVIGWPGMTFKECEDARPYFDRGGWRAGPCVPYGSIEVPLK